MYSQFKYVLFSYKTKKWIILYIDIAIVAEVIATNELKSSEEFTKLIPNITIILCCCTSFYFLTLVIKTIPVGIVYAIWSGLGIILITILAGITYKQILNIPSIIGILLMISDVTIINFSSRNIIR